MDTHSDRSGRGRLRRGTPNPSVVLASCLTVWLPVVIWAATKLPALPEMTGDSVSYLELASHRPPVYGWLLHAHQWLNGGLDHLPLLQLGLLAAGLLVFAVELGRLLRSGLAAALAISLVLWHPDIYAAPREVMTEAVFMALELAGLGLQFRYVRQGSMAALIGTAICFALATGTRTAGAVLLPLPLLAALLDRRFGPAAALGRSLRAGLAACLVLLAILSANLARHGHFEIGSWAGVSLLGKGLLLATEADLAELPPAAASSVSAAADLRRLIASQPDLATQLRAQRQAYADLRYPLFFPAAEAGWPEWARTDDRGRGQLAMTLARKVIVRHPAAYLRLLSRDWLSLLIYPAYWPAWLSAEVTDPGAFPACRLQRNCWELERYDIPLRGLAVLLAVSAATAIGILLQVPFALLPVLRRRASPEIALFWLVAVLAAASLQATAAFEAGLSRYAAVSHVLGVALLLWFMIRLLRRFAPVWPRWPVPLVQRSPG